jgi:hypothetical protein
MNLSLAEYAANFKNLLYWSKREAVTMEKLTHEQFFTRAIKNCRRDGYKGIHTVYSGVNQAFREYFGKDADPVAAVNKLMQEGKLAGNPAKGGFTIYLLEDAKSKPVQATLAKILAD